MINSKEYISKEGEAISDRSTTPLKNTYWPEIGISKYIGPQETSYYPSLIGILHLIVELGRVDICMDVLMMLSHLELPRRGYLEQVLTMFGFQINITMLRWYLIQVNLLFSQNTSNVNTGIQLFMGISKNNRHIICLIPEDWESGWEYMCIAITTETQLIDDQEMDSLFSWMKLQFIGFPRRKHHVKQVPLEASLLQWSKLFNMSEELFYKIRVFGIPCQDPTFVYSNNQFLLDNTSVPTSMINNKSNSVYFHFLWELCAHYEWRTKYVNTHEIPADLLKKPLASGEKRWRFVGIFLYWFWANKRRCVCML